MRSFFLCLLPITIFCSNSEPPTLEVGAGYKRDDFCFKILTDTENESLVCKEKYNHLNYLETEALFKVIDRDLYFLFYATRSFYGSGTARQEMYESESNQSNAEGWDYSGRVAIGYQANLFEGRISKFFLTPILGYDILWKRLKKLDGDEIFKKRVNDSFYGTLFGVDLNYQKEVYGFNLSYFYKWTSIHHSSYALYSGQEYKFKADSIHARWHEGIFGASYFPNHFRIDLNFKVHYIISESGEHISTYIGEDEKVKNKFLLRWNDISVVLALGYRF